MKLLNSKHKIATFNCVSLTNRKMKEWVLELILEERDDIVLLQETNLCFTEYARSFLRFFDNLFLRFCTVIAVPPGELQLIGKTLLAA